MAAKSLIAGCALRKQEGTCNFDTLNYPPTQRINYREINAMFACTVGKLKQRRGPVGKKTGRASRLVRFAGHNLTRPASSLFRGRTAATVYPSRQ